MKKIIYTFLLLFITTTSYADYFWTNRITENLKNWTGDLVWTADGILWYIIWLFYFVAVAVWIYGWFLILVSGWDEERVKKWKNYLVYMVIWLIVIFLASIIVRWVIGVMTNRTIVW